MSKQNPRIFISSTMQDLKEYREQVREAILRVGATPVLAEERIAAGDSISEVVKGEIDESDAILLLVGHRYGELDSQSGKSWTELEYDLAKSRAKPLLVFMASADSPWPPKYIDSDQTKIQQFRERLASDVVVRSFENPSNLRTEVIAALSQFVSALKQAPQIEGDREPTNKREIRIIRLLLSSPGDVAKERERVVKAVFRFNQHAVEENGLFIKLVRWEDMAPQIGPKAQSVINKQINEYHIFLGIMWNRFGTPTEIAASGTKEEFDGAVHCWENGGRPWITFYFCDRPANFTNEGQLNQKRSVLEFRTQLYSRGVVRSFHQANEFEAVLYEDLKRITKIPEFLTMLDGK